MLKIFLLTLLMISYTTIADEGSELVKSAKAVKSAMSAVSKACVP